MKKLFLLATTILALSSCNVYRTISFNADHSGTMENKIDMSSMMAMMNENGGGSGMGNMNDMAELDKTKAMFEGISGISNVKVSFDTTGIIYNSYDFNSTEALVNAMNSSGSATNSMMMGMAENGSSTAKMKLTFKGKKFFFEEVDKKTLKTLQDKEKQKEMGEMDMLMASSKIITTINFPTQVKKVSYKNASITNDKSVSYEMLMKDLTSLDYKPLTINLK